MFLLVLSLILPALSVSLGIFGISGPSVMVNKSLEMVVLDCNYHLREGDKQSLVVKWFFNEQPIPVYQWIPPDHPPQDLGILKHRLDLGYVAHRNPYMKHRALAIRNPTCDLSGEYTCRISSFEGEASKTKSLMIYSPPSEMSLTWNKPSMDTVRVSCTAGGMYPEPDIVIYKSSYSTRRKVIRNLSIQSFSIGGSHNISAQITMFEYELREQTLFECVVTLPETNYEAKEQMIYYPSSGAVEPCLADPLLAAALVLQCLHQGHRWWISLILSVVMLILNT
ncbi:unnamed protein product [Meganyctiphanes norvegica]|uniref:Ig-like domain-containing protein n=1 Tax=Meganyctiphanes norvegica TaxID=48144 RepID=A0AAV2Q3H1_MEGNR